MESKEAQTAVEPLGDASEDDGGKRVSRRARIGIAIGCAALLMAALVAACSLCSPGPGETVDEAETESGQSASGSSEEEAPGDEEAEPLADEEAEAASDTDTEPASSGDASTDGEPASTAAARAASGASGGARPAASQPASEPEHQHSWQAVTEQKWVEDSAAWDEPVYQTQEREICTGCGADITGTPYSHIAQTRNSPCQGFKSVTKSVLVNTIHHEASGHYATITTGYRCACGATK